jgi:hypothetical protein
LTGETFELDVYSIGVSLTMGEEAIQPAESPKRAVANVCYTLGTCLVALVGLYVWLGSDRLVHEHLAPLPVVSKSTGPSIEEQLRRVKPSPSQAVAATPAPHPGAHSAYRHVSTAGSTAIKPPFKRRAVQGGITIVGRHGTTTTVAPPTASDRNARPEYSTPVFARASGEFVVPAAPTGPRFYLPPGAAPCSPESSPSGDLHFYNFDDHITQAVQTLNRGEDGSKWSKRVIVHPFE